MRKFYVSVQGDEEAARRRLSQTVRSNLAEEFNKRTMHEAISTQRDQIMSATRLKADGDARNIGVEIVDVRLRRMTPQSSPFEAFEKALGVSATSARTLAAAAWVLGDPRAQGLLDEMAATRMSGAGATVLAPRTVH